MLLKRAMERPLEPRPAPPRVAPVLEKVTLVLELAGRPMRACEIHAAANELVGAPLRWRSVKGILSAYTIGGDKRFRRVRRGVYQITRPTLDTAPATTLPYGSDLPGASLRQEAGHDGVRRGRVEL